jgi:hypothetical protein
MIDNKQKCSNCGAEEFFITRYPHQICEECIKKLTDKNGRPVEFVNTTMLGSGCQGYYTDVTPNKKYSSSSCYINGVEFYAVEGKFGGIMIRKSSPKGET